MPQRPSASKLIKLATLWLAKCMGLFALSRFLTRDSLRILCYHGIWMGEGHFSDFLFMSAGKFNRRMAWLKSSSYPVLPLQDALQHLKNRTLPHCAAVITIDDGWYGTYVHMLPSLLKHDLPATLYVSTYYMEHQLPVFNVAVQYVLARCGKRKLLLSNVGLESQESYELDREVERNAAVGRIIQAFSTLNGAQRAAVLQRLADELNFDLIPVIRDRILHLMTEAEIRDSARRGLDIQLHTHRHRLTLGNEGEIDVEIRDNRASLSKILPGPFEHFCYPSGIWSKDVWSALLRNNIQSATTTEQGLNDVSQNTLGLKRLLDGESLYQIEMEAELSGFIDIKRRLAKSLGRRA